MKISDAGIALIKTGEGFKSHLYNCPAHNCSIAYGHLVHLGPICGAVSEAPFKDRITEQQGTALLMQDVGYAEHVVELS